MDSDADLEGKISGAETTDANDNCCPECKSERIVKDYDRAELVCANCGLVLSGIGEAIDLGPEWYNHADNPDRARTGPPPSKFLPDKGLSTEISGFSDFSGRALPEKAKRQVYRMMKWQHRTRSDSAMQRNLITAMGELSRMSAVMELPKSIKEEAAGIYREAYANFLTHGRSINEVVATSIYAACRNYNCPRTLKEVADASSDISHKKIGRTYRLLLRELKFAAPLPEPNQYLPRICSELNLSPNVENKAREIIESAKSYPRADLTSGKSPLGTVAASTYIASVLCGKGRTQKDVAKAAGITEVTLRNRFHELRDELGFRIETSGKIAKVSA